MEIGQIKILVAILAVVTAIGGAAAIWKSDHEKEQEIMDKAKEPAHQYDPEKVKSITAEDLF